MMNPEISWRNAGEIPLGFLHEILQLIMEKNEKCVLNPTSTVYYPLCQIGSKLKILLCLIRGDIQSIY